MSFKVLIVDDSPTVRIVLKRTLALTNVECDQLYEAGNGLEALEVLKQDPVDLVLTDLNMPEMDGVELIEQMQADPQLRKVPTIVISTEGSKVRLDELHNRGISGYLRKPFTPEQFNEVIHSVLEQTHENRV